MAWTRRKTVKPSDNAKGKTCGEFYMPSCVVKLLVEVLEPYCGRVYDPCPGLSGGNRIEPIDHEYRQGLVTHFPENKLLGQH